MGNYTIKELSQKLRNKEISATELTKDYLDRAEKSILNAYTHIDREGALIQAAHADKVLAQEGSNAPILTGIPLAIKDNICIEGLPMTCSSKMLANYIPPYTATVINKLKNNNAVFIGKANMDEFAMGATNETSYFGKVLNPIDNARIPGGSSGGSAAAVGGDIAVAALGSDTGGSIRQPSAHCGVVGLKPTYGTVSRFGVGAFGSSLDQVGVIAKNVYDASVTLNAITGYDDLDSTSQNIAYPDYTKSFNENVKGLKIGLPREFFEVELDPDVKNKVLEAIKVYEKNGAEIVDISLPHTDSGLSSYFIIACAEAASNLARFDGIKFGYRAENVKSLEELYVKTRTESFGSEVKRRIMLGNYVLSSGYYDAYYLKAQKIRTLIKQDMEKAFAKCDIIAGPTTPFTAHRFDEKFDDPLKAYLSDIYTVLTNLAGIPAMSIPCGKTSNGLAIGLQLMGNAFCEGTILNAADLYEKVEGHKWSTK